MAKLVGIEADLYKCLQFVLHPLVKDWTSVEFEGSLILDIRKILELFTSIYPKYSRMKMSSLQGALHGLKDKNLIKYEKYVGGIPKRHTLQVSNKPWYSSSREMRSQRRAERIKSNNVIPINFTRTIAPPVMSIGVEFLKHINDFPNTPYEITLPVNCTEEARRAVYAALSLFQNVVVKPKGIFNQVTGQVTEDPNVLVAYRTESIPV